MKGFDDVTLSWKGESFTVKAEDQMMLIARIEDALSGQSGTQAIQVLMRRDGPPYSRLASAFGAALRYAGAEVTDADVYLSIMSDLGEGKAEAAVRVQGAVLALLSIIAPPIAQQIIGDPVGKPEPADGESSEASST